MAILNYFKRRQRRKATQNRRTKPAPTKNSSRRWFSRQLVHAFAILAVWGACAFNAVYRSSLTSADALTFVLEQRIDQNVHANVGFDYPDLAETEIRRRYAEDQVLDIYRLDSATTELTQQYFDELIKLVASKSDGSRTGNFAAPVVELFESLEPARLESFAALFDSGDKQAFFRKKLKSILHGGIFSQRDEGLLAAEKTITIVDENARRTKALVAELHSPTSAARQLVEGMSAQFQNLPIKQEGLDRIIARLIRPNLGYELALTKTARAEARDSVPVSREWVREGEVFLQKGSNVSENDLMKLEAYRKALNASQDSNQYYLEVGSILVLSLLTILLGAGYLVNSFPKMFNRLAVVSLVACTLVMGIVLNRAIGELLFFIQSGSLIYVTPALPLSFVAVLLTLLLNQQKGTAIGIFLSIIIAVQASDPMHVFVLGLFSSCAGAYAVRSARTRTQTFRAVIFIALSVFVVEGVYLSLKSTPWPIYISVLGIAFANGLLVMILANLLLPIAEYLFGITTDISLLELSDLNHPLLKRLQLEAPGTYHHTLMVATLSEHAAEAIGANTLLARVSAYFHDIGKLSNPSYFTENSLGVDRHKDLSPRMSALIIINHVKEGLAMAAKSKLKRPLRDAIATHHGTSLIAFFYHRAKTESKNGELNEEDYRYPGPLPRSKEASIISVADACEAASRSLEKPTPQKIDSLVSDIFRNRVLDGQLDESELTMTEINAVRESIKKTLRTMLHGRISYPRIDIDDDGNLNIEPQGNSGPQPSEDDKNTDSDGGKSNNDENRAAS